MDGILLFYHCAQDTQYAIPTLERRFQTMAERLVSEDDVHYAYPVVTDGPSRPSDASSGNVLRFDPTDDSPEALDRLSNYLRTHGIDFGFGFDAPVRRKSYRVMRRAGIESIVSYWGAPMSSTKSGVELLLKKLEVLLYRWRPDHFIFESRAMAETAVHGRGIPERDVSVVHLGVDPDEFSPDIGRPGYLADVLDIPANRKVLVFSGHMERRKGVHVLMRAANALYKDRDRRDFQVLVLGNQPGEEQPFLDLLSPEGVREHVTFGGYRDDIAAIFPHCSVGVLPSTGWDSFTVSALEMAASGLPLVVSNLQGLAETVEEGTTGLLFRPGDHEELADRLEFLLDRPERRADFGAAARERVLRRFTPSQQVDGLVSVCRAVDRGAR